MSTSPAPPTPRPRPAAHTNPGVLLLVLLLDLGFGLWVAAQYTAWRFAYHPNLGAPVWIASPPAERYALALAVLLAGGALALLGVAGHRRFSGLLLLLAGALYVASAAPVYSPLRYLAWARAYDGIPAFSGILTGGLYALAAGVCVAFLASAFAVGRRPSHVPPTSHGTAAWGSASALKVPAKRKVRKATKEPTGVLVGRKDGELLEHRGEGSLITIAPGRTGKGLQLVATMLTYPGPMLIGDFKDGENYHITAAARRALGHTVIALDPFGVVGGAGTFNPLVLIDEDDPEAGDNADLLADMLVVTDSRDRDAVHFTEIARTVIGGVILHVATTRGGTERSLPTVRQLLAQPEEQIEELLQEMLRNPAAGGQVSSAAATVLQAKEKERGSIMTTVLRHTRFLESPRMQRFFSQETGNVDFADLKRGDVTLYLVLPARHLGGKHKRWARLMITCAIHTMTTTPGRSFHPNVWPLDEFGNLGRMDPVADGITLVGGYGVRFWPIFQDHSQGEEIYGKRWKSFLAGAEVKQIFGVSDLDTAKYWSEYMGEETIEVESENRSKGRSSSGGFVSGTLSTGTARTTSERGRRLLTPDEIIRLPRTQQLLIVRDEPPILSEKLNYLTDPEFRQLASPNPMYARAAAQFAAAGNSGSPPEHPGKDTSRNVEVGERLTAIRTFDAAPAGTDWGKR